MARRGRFGRLPRAAPDLTNMIVSLAREALDAEDRAIYDAWQNGGLFRGEPVTDSRLLAHIKGRRDALSEKDPKWDHWNNEFIQLDFKIGEEKIVLDFNQGKVGIGAVVQFYRNKMATIPKDSQFYREIAGRAEQWAKSAVAQGRASSRKALSDSQETRIDAALNIQRHADDIEWYIRYAAQAQYGFDGDPSEMDATDLQNLLASGGVRDGAGNVITMEDWRTSQQAKYSAFGTLIDASEKLGRTTATLRKNQREYVEHIQKINTVDDRAKFEMVDAQLQSDLDECKGLPSCEIAARDRYITNLQGVVATAEAAHGGDENWSLFIGAVRNRAVALATGKEVEATPERIASALGVESTTDMLNVFYGPEGSVPMQEMLDTGRGVWGQQTFNSEFKVIPVQTNAMTGQPTLAPEQQLSFVAIDGVLTPVYLSGQPVYANGLLSPDGVSPVNPDDYTAEELRVMLATGQVQAAKGKSDVVGYVFNNPQTNIRRYAVLDPETGDWKYTTRNPFKNVQAGPDGQPVVFLRGEFTNFALNTDDNAEPDFQYTVNPSTGVLNDDFVRTDGTLRADMLSDLMVDRNVNASQMLDFAKTVQDEGLRQKIINTGVSMNTHKRLSPDERDELRNAERAADPNNEARRAANYAAAFGKQLAEKFGQGNRPKYELVEPTVRSAPRSTVASLMAQGRRLQAERATAEVSRPAPAPAPSLPPPPPPTFVTPARTDYLPPAPPPPPPPEPTFVTPAQTDYIPPEPLPPRNPYIRERGATEF